MDWDEIDDSEFEEIAKFEPANGADSLLYNEPVASLFIEPDWKTLDRYINSWNKVRHKINCYKIVLCEGTPFDGDFVDKEIKLYLDMGKRLLKQMKIMSKKKPKFLKILRIGDTTDPKRKYDIQYHVSSYKLYKKPQSKLK